MILRIFSKLIHWAGSRIDTERPAVGAPPKSLWRFMAWNLTGAWPVIFFGASISVIASAAEVSTMFLLGRIVDVAGSADSIVLEHLSLVVFAASTSESSADVASSKTRIGAS